MPVREQRAARRGSRPVGDSQAIPIFGLGPYQRTPFVSTVARVNCVVEKTPDGRQHSAIFGLPGLFSFLEVGATPIRAYYIREGEDIFYVVSGDQFLSVTLAGEQTVLETLGTFNGPAWIADNGDEIFVNDGVTPTIHDTTTGVTTQVTDPGYPDGALGATFHNGRFWVFTPQGATDQGRVYGSAPYDGLSWDGLDFFTPESVPDGIVDVFRWKNDLIVWGQSSIEFWNSVQSSVPGALGYASIAGAATEVGLAATQGYAPAGQQLFFLGRMRGQASAFELRGYQPIQVSVPKLDAEWAQLASRAGAVATGYVVAGHPLFQITFPLLTAGGQTWVYDASSQLWSERVSFGLPFYRGLFAQTSKDRVFMTSAFSGKIYLIAERYYAEEGDPLIREVTSIHLLKEGDQLAVDSMWADMETGLGTTDGQGENPQAMIQISKDGGHVWGEERFVPIGKTGKYTTRAIRRRIGSARDLAIKFRITDPVPFRVTGAYLRLTPGQS